MSAPFFIKEFEMVEQIVLPNRQHFYGILNERVQSSRRRVKIAQLIEPYFVRAETGKYVLHDRKQLTQRRVINALNESLRTDIADVKFCSAARPITREPWMSYEAYEALLTDYSLRCIWNSTSDLSMRHALDNAYGQNLNQNFSELLHEAEDIMHQCFGNKLWQSTNKSLFSGVGYVIETSLKYFLAFQLSNNSKMQIWLDPLIRLLLRAVPLGSRTDRHDVWVVLVA